MTLLYFKTTAMIVVSSCVRGSGKYFTSIPNVGLAVLRGTQYIPSPSTDSHTQQTQFLLCGRFLSVTGGGGGRVLAVGSEFLHASRDCSQTQEFLHRRSRRDRGDPTATHLPFFLETPPKFSLRFFLPIIVFILGGSFQGSFRLLKSASHVRI